MYMKRLVIIGSPDEQAKEVFDLLYPTGNADGDEKTRRNALKRLIEVAKDRQHPQQIMTLPQDYTGRYEVGQYTMIWSYPHKWIELYKLAPVASQLVNT